MFRIRVVLFFVFIFFIGFVSAQETCVQEVDCFDNNPCTVDSCGQNHSCSHNIIEEGSFCGNNWTCNGEGVCVNPYENLCEHDVDCSDDNECTIDICGLDNTCSYGFVPLGGSCGQGGNCDGEGNCVSSYEDNFTNEDDLSDGDNDEDSGEHEGEDGNVICDSGCLREEICLSVGDRITTSYCSPGLEMMPQLGAGELCDNDFECRSNSCSDDVCADMGLWASIIQFFAGFFRGN